MCKVMITAGIKASHRDNALKFIKEMSKLMTLANNDGLGYAAVNDKGQLFAERWLDNKDAFTEVKAPHPKSDFMTKQFDKFVKGTFRESPRYTKYGVTDLENMTAMTLHTRMATSAKGMLNVHPFIMDDTSVIHNGVITNDTEFNLKLSTCDSEAVLISYLESGVNLDIKSVQAMAETLVGYYACGVFSRDKNQRRILDIFNGNNDNLYCGWINELDTWVISTAKDNIEAACKTLGFMHNSINQMMDDKIMRIDIITGELMLGDSFRSGPRWKQQATQYNNNYGHNYTPPTPPPTPPATVTHLPMSSSKSKNMTQAEIDYYEMKTSISIVPEREMNEMLKAMY